MTYHELRNAISDLPAVPAREREELLEKIREAIRARGGHFDSNDVRYTIGKDGSLKPGLRW